MPLLVEIIVGSLYNESIYHLLDVKRGAIMKKLFLLLTIFSLFTTSAFAVSLDELRNSPERYKHIYADQTLDGYVEIPSINVTRYNPPYYIINATMYMVDYETNIIGKIDTTFFYDYNRSSEVLKKELPDNMLILEEQEKNSGIQWKMSGVTDYHFDGSIYSPYLHINPADPKFSPEEAPITSLGYMAATYSFYKAYNMHFNALTDEHVF